MFQKDATDQKIINKSRRPLRSADLQNFHKTNKKLKIYFLRKLDSTSYKNPFDSFECERTVYRANISRFHLL